MNNPDKSIEAIQRLFKGRRALAIVSALKNNISRESNLERNQQLKFKVRKGGYGYVFIDGQWSDCNDSVDFNEDAILVIGGENDNGKLKGLIRKWVKEFEQEAMIFKNSNSQDFELIYPQGGEIVGQFDADSFSRAYSIMRCKEGLKFNFDGRVRSDSNWISQMAGKKFSYENWKNFGHDMAKVLSD